MLLGVCHQGRSGQGVKIGQQALNHAESAVDKVLGRESVRRRTGGRDVDDLEGLLGMHQHLDVAILRIASSKVEMLSQHVRTSSTLCKHDDLSQLVDLEDVAWART